VSVRRVDQAMAATAAELLPKTVDKELRTRYRQLRAMLHQAGLAATYAFVASKATGQGKLPDAYRLVAQGIQKRLAALGVLTQDPASATHRDVFEALGKAEAPDYARASAEVAALAGWLSRLADALYVPAEAGHVPADTGQCSGEPSGQGGREPSGKGGS
jgi:CRISPR/Cas system CMR-associated protein Cmr5 small subunit